MVVGEIMGVVQRVNAMLSSSLAQVGRWAGGAVGVGGGGDGGGSGWMGWRPGSIGAGVCVALPGVRWCRGRAGGEVLRVRLIRGRGGGGAEGVIGIAWLSHMPPRRRCLE